MDPLLKILIKRIQKKGLEHYLVQSFIRDLSNIILSSAEPELQELNRKMSSLGWDDFELDDHTFQLIEAVLEKEAFFNGKRGKNILLLGKGLNGGVVVTNTGMNV